ncbi:hypothetical protein RSOLAG22IIIB_14021 [Rhizoctonia solani]|uniref:Uncharacterized protein n=1 Tax=Rhizoctonia solani TaxID=456999 RepID=A0A0K6FT80_9AGAM|nr:hypothetical protein RSOLAG22IIIB_14021 [Rhizoctonia solani]
MPPATANFGPRQLLVSVVVGSNKFVVENTPVTRTIQGEYDGPTEGEQPFVVTPAGDQVIIKIGGGVFHGLDPSGQPLLPGTGEGKWEDA